MTHKQFRTLLIFSALFTLSTIAYGIYTGIKLGSDAAIMVSEIQSDKQLNMYVTDQAETLSTARTMRTVLGVTAAVLGLIAWVGLFYFWKPSRIIFSLNIMLLYVIGPFINYSALEAIRSGPLVDHYSKFFSNNLDPVNSIMTSIGTFIDSAIIIVIFTSLGSHLFSEHKETKKT